MKRRVLLCYGYSPAVPAYFFQRAFRRDPYLRERYCVTSCGPTHLNFKTDIPCDTGSDLEHVVRRLERQGGVDLVLYVDGNNFVPLRVATTPAPTVFFLSDWKKRFDWYSKYATLFDLVIVPWVEAEEALSRHGVENVITEFWGGFDPEIFYPQHLPKAFDVTFAGWLDHRMCRYRGKSLERLVKLGAEGLKINLVQGKYLGEIATIYNRSTLLFNKGWDDGYNTRVMESMACGRPVLTPPVEEDANALGFRNREHLIHYSDDDELEHLVRYYLENEEEREAVALRGYEKVRKEFSYGQVLRRAMARVERFFSLDRAASGRRPFSRSHTPGEMEVTYLEGVSCCYAALHSAAEERFRKLLTSNHYDHCEVENYLGVSLACQKRLADARVHFERAASLDTKRPVPLLNLALLHLLSKDFEKAKAPLLAMLAILEETPPEAIITEDMFFGLNFDRFKWDAEEARYLHRHRDNQTYTRKMVANLAFKASHILAEVAFQQGDVSNAAGYLEEAKRLKEDDGYISNALGKVCLSRGEYRKAEEHFRAAIRLEPFFTEAEELLTTAIEKQEKDPRPAEEHAKRVQPSTR